MLLTNGDVDRFAAEMDAASSLGSLLSSPDSRQAERPSERAQP